MRQKWIRKTDRTPFATTPGQLDLSKTSPKPTAILGQYIRRSVISDHRILALEGNRVRIRIKNRDTGSFEPRVMNGVEFVRRFLLHALPERFHRIRYRGFLHARGKPRLLWLQLLLDAKLQPAMASAPARCQTPTTPGIHTGPWTGDRLPALRMPHAQNQKDAPGPSSPS
ncbi:transposase [Puniceicoccus vermicola]|uniref:Transposase n=1 Tax=Puniceicoccus vermicola TaxID=388746 RepID=A0A7X1E6N0_9BACT|nr:transposase [Puniceicoccus vermicola]